MFLPSLDRLQEKSSPGRGTQVEKGGDRVQQIGQKGLGVKHGSETSSKKRKAVEN